MKTIISRQTPTPIMGINKPFQRHISRAYRNDKFSVLEIHRGKH